jgi:hypothetical protein
VKSTNFAVISNHYVLAFMQIIFPSIMFWNALRFYSSPIVRGVYTRIKQQNNYKFGNFNICVVDSQNSEKQNNVDVNVERTLQIHVCLLLILFSQNFHLPMSSDSWELPHFKMIYYLLVKQKIFGIDVKKGTNMKSEEDCYLVPQSNALSISQDTLYIFRKATQNVLEGSQNNCI